MSIKRKIENGIGIILGFPGLVFRRLFGNRISFSVFSFVSLRASIKTYDNGRIYIGKKVAIRDNTELSVSKGHIIIGDNCFINKNCMVIAHEQIEIGAFTTIGPNVCIYDHDHDNDNGDYISSPILIGEKVWIGAGCILLKGITIGDNVTIGAGSIVTKDIPSNTIYFNKLIPVLMKK